MKIEIRSEALADVPGIEAVTIAAFQRAAHTGHTEQYIAAALRRAGKLTLSLVAAAGGQVVGHVAVSPVAISDRTPAWFGLGPIAVLPEYQRRGVGALLVKAALRALCERAAAGCVVLGEPRYYERFGFRSVPSLSLPGVPPSYFLAISFGTCWPQGTVRYDEAFNAQG